MISILPLLFVLTLSQSNINCQSAFCSQCDAEKCTQCIDNYILKDGVCDYCRTVEPLCFSAKNGVCTKCINTHILVNGVCVEKDPNCEEYYGEDDDDDHDDHDDHDDDDDDDDDDDWDAKYTAGQCKECRDGYRLTTEGKCEACKIKGCEDCSRDVNSCEECIDNYYFKNGECTQPIPNCDEYDDDNGRCEECMFGYYLKNGECVKIAEDNCRRMQNGVCVQCFGPFKPVNGSCVETESQASVIEHCIEYDEDGEFECETCETGYYTNEREDKCLKCSEECKTCDDSSNECESCNEGFYVKNNKCVKCTNALAECSTYATEGECYQCNHKCNWENRKCVESHCAVYQEDEEDAICVKCEDGYVLSQTGMTCVASADGCKTYGDAEKTKCVECHNGYFITADFKCSKCDDACKTCAGAANQCHSCHDDLDEYRNPQSCMKCSIPNCIECSASAIECTKCAANYTLSEVGDCIKGCFSADCDGKCTMCSDTENNMDIIYPPTEEGVCLKYSQMPNTPTSNAYHVMVVVLVALIALLF